MMRFRVFAWLATLVVLAGCVGISAAENGDTSTTPDVDNGGVAQTSDLIISQSCELLSDRGQRGFPRDSFRVFPESAERFPAVFISSDSSAVEIRWLKLGTLEHCATTITSISGNNDESSDLTINPIPPSEWRLQKEAKFAFDSAVHQCELLGRSASGLYSNYSAEFRPEEDSYVYFGGFISCTSMIKSSTHGFIIGQGDKEYRIISVLGRLTILEK